MPENRKEVVDISIVGNDVVLLVNTGTAAAPAYQLIGEQRSLTYDLERELIDASHKGSDFTHNLYGRQSGTMSLDALYPDPAAGTAATQSRLLQAQNNKEEIVVRMRVGTQIQESSVLVSSVSTEFPDNDVSAFSAELALQRPFSVVAAAAVVAGAENLEQEGVQRPQTQTEEQEQQLQDVQQEQPVQ